MRDAYSTSVNANAESFRSQFVAHKGQEHTGIETGHTFGVTKVFADELDKKSMSLTTLVNVTSVLRNHLGRSCSTKHSKTGS